MRQHNLTSGDLSRDQTHRLPAEKLKGKPSSSSHYKDMALDARRSSSPDKMGRSSFSSVRENDSELAQAFTASKFSSYDPYSEQAVEDHSASTTRGPSPDLSSSPRSADWMQLNVGTMTASSGLDIVCAAEYGASWNDRQKLGASASLSPIETLPPEVFDLIVRYLVLDIPPNGVERRNVDLIALLLTSKAVASKTITTIYRRVTIPHSRIFQKFLAQISANPQCGKLVRRLDFSHFNPATLFSTAKERAAARNLTPETLLRCLELTPDLQEFLVQEYIDEDLSPEVLQKLFLGLDRIRALDFCGCSSSSFAEAFSSAPSWDWPETVGIKRLSLHKCRVLPSSVFETILPRLKGLTHLDVAGTKITDKALNSISPHARITHLNLATCRLLTIEGIIKFLSTHPAVRDGLEFLSLATDARIQDSIDSADVTRILRVLPKTLQSLSLKGSQMDSSHLELLRPLTRHLEELAIGHGLSLEELDQLFVQDKSTKTTTKRPDRPQSTLKFLDMTDMWESELTGLYTDSVLLTKASYPLEVIELTPDFMKRMTKTPTRLSKFGWTLSEVHRRSWIVRMADPSMPRDDGRRPWKMGARFWGMRKIPVARGEVGGMYGSFMFGRNL